jgi:CDP-paratose 2-epimerase
MSITIVTGSAGLVGSEAVLFFAEIGFNVVGIDNDMRRAFFGDGAAARNCRVRSCGQEINYFIAVFRQRFSRDRS